jgi:hypothetical protein
MRADDKAVSYFPPPTLSVRQHLYMVPHYVERWRNIGSSGQAVQTFKHVPVEWNGINYPWRSVHIDYAHTSSSFQAILTTLRQMTDHLMWCLMVVIVDASKRPHRGIAAELGSCFYYWITRVRKVLKPLSSRLKVASHKNIWKR